MKIRTSLTEMPVYCENYYAHWQNHNTSKKHYYHITLAETTTELHPQKQKSNSISLLYRVAQKNPALYSRVVKIYQPKKHTCNEQTSLNIHRNFCLKHFYTSRDRNRIVLHIIKQIMQMAGHLHCCSYAGYSRTSQ